MKNTKKNVAIGTIVILAVCAGVVTGCTTYAHFNKEDVETANVITTAATVTEEVVKEVDVTEAVVKATEVEVTTATQKTTEATTEVKVQKATTETQRATTETQATKTTTATTATVTVKTTEAATTHTHSWSTQTIHHDAEYTFEWHEVADDGFDFDAAGYNGQQIIDYCRTNECGSRDCDVQVLVTAAYDETVTVCATCGARQ